MSTFKEVILYAEKNTVKYAHILVTGGIFSTNLVKYFIRNTKTFPAKSYMVIINSSVPDKIGCENNIFYVMDMDKHVLDLMEMLEPYIEHFVVHNLDFNLSLTIPRHIANKTVWRTWGSDMNFSLSYVPTLRTKLHMFRKHLLWNLVSKSHVREFEAVGVSSTGCDRILLEKQKIDLPVYTLPYPTDYWAEDIEQLLKTPFSDLRKEKDEIWIMIGHSANSSLKHIRYIKLLSHLKKDNVRIIMPMVYGRNEYREKVTRVAKEVFGDKAIILKKQLSYDNYVRMLNLVDIAIFDAKHQMGLGNIVDLLLLGKVVFLNEKGIVFATLKEKNVRVESTNSLRKLASYEVLQKLIDENDAETGKKYAYDIRTKEFVDSKWQLFFDRVGGKEK